MPKLLPFDAHGATVADLTRAVQALPQEPVSREDYTRLDELVEWIGKAALALTPAPAGPSVPPSGVPEGEPYYADHPALVTAIAALTALVPPPADATAEHYALIRGWCGWIWHAQLGLRQGAPAAWTLGLPELPPLPAR